MNMPWEDLQLNLGISATAKVIMVVVASTARKWRMATTKASSAAWAFVASFCCSSSLGLALGKVADTFNLLATAIVVDTGKMAAGVVSTIFSKVHSSSSRSRSWSWSGSSFIGDKYKPTTNHSPASSSLAIG